MELGTPVAARLALRVYGLALRLLPGSFREPYRDELWGCFERMVLEANDRRGWIGVVLVAVRSVLDVVGTAIQQRWVARSRERRAGRLWSGLGQDVKQGARRLVRQPSFTVTTVLTLGLGIAAAASVFTLVYGVVLSPLPYPEADRLVEVDHAAPGIGAPRDLGITFGFYRYYAAHARSTEAMAMYSYVDQTLTGRGDPVRLRGVLTTPSLSDVLRVPARLGRWFTPDDAQPGAALTVVLSHWLWQERFGGDASVIGERVDLGGVQREVIGVMPRTFAFPSAVYGFWIPRVLPQARVGGWNERAIARLAPASGPLTLQDELVGLLPAMRESTDDPATLGTYLDDARVTPLVVPLKESMLGDVRATLWILLGTVGFVLLIAVANVANLFLVRAEEGQREVAVRSALGAGRTRIVRAFLVETLLISFCAGALGLAAASAAIRVLRARAPVNVPRLDEVSLSPVVLLVLLLTTIAAALVLGVIPALRGRSDPGAVLAEGGRRSTAGRARRRGRDVLMAAQVALALALLIASGLLLRTFRELRAVDLGFGERQALTFEIGLPASRYASRAETKAFQDRVHERLAALPGVRAVGAVGQCLPLVGFMCWGDVFEAEGHPPVPGSVPPVTGARIASAGYFDALRIAVRGRAFTPADEIGDATVAVLSRSAAEAYFPGEDPIGKRIRFASADAWQTVVGVADDVRGKVETNEPDRLQRVIYLPMLPEGESGPGPERVAYVLSTTVPPTSLIPAVRRVLGELDETIPLANVRTIQQVIDEATAPTAFALTTIAVAAAIALLLGAVGVYAVLAYAVSCRTAEIGVRMALGARSADVRTMILRQGGRVVLGGIAIGLAVAFASTRLMQGMLYGISPTDPVSYVGLTLLMLLIAGTALWLPARRASRVDPMQALRRE